MVVEGGEKEWATTQAASQAHQLVNSRLTISSQLTAPLVTRRLLATVSRCPNACVRHRPGGVCSSAAQSLDDVEDAASATPIVDSGKEEEGNPVPLYEDGNGSSEPPQAIGVSSCQKTAPPPDTVVVVGGNG